MLILVVLNVSTAREVMNALAATQTTLDVPSAIQVVSHVSEDASAYAMHALSATATAIVVMADVKEHRPAYPVIQVRVVFLDARATSQQDVQDAMLIITDAEQDLVLPAIEVRLNMSVPPATLDVKQVIFVELVMPLVIVKNFIQQVLKVVQTMITIMKSKVVCLIINLVILCLEEHARVVILRMMIHYHVLLTIKAEIRVVVVNTQKMQVFRVSQTLI